MVNWIDDYISIQQGNTIRTIQLGNMVINRRFIVNVETKQQGKERQNKLFFIKLCFIRLKLYAEMGNICKIFDSYLK